MNYRTTEEIGKKAAAAISDLDLRATELPRAVRNGEEALIERFSEFEDEALWIADQIVKLQKKAIKRLLSFSKLKRDLEKMESYLIEEDIRYNPIYRSDKNLNKMM